MKNFLKNIHNSLKGKKRNIGIIAGWVLNGVTLFFPQVLPVEHSTWIRLGIDIFCGIGLVDAVSRTDTGKRVVDASMNKMKSIGATVVNPIKETLKFKN